MSLTRAKPWTRPDNLVPKAQTRRQDDKGPARSESWKVRIRALPCLCCADGQQHHPTEAHHARGLFPRTMGKRISDLLMLPLCQWHHRIGPAALHRTGDEANWWRSVGVEPYGTLLSTLVSCRDQGRDEAIAFVKLHRERGRMHHKLGFGKPPVVIASLQARMLRYAERFDTAGKPQHGDVIRGWALEIAKDGAAEDARDPEGRGWMPIETAPKDGTEILVCWHLGGTMSVASWFGDAWAEANDDTFCESAPTRWQPLPSPPADEDAQPSTERGEANSNHSGDRT